MNWKRWKFGLAVACLSGLLTGLAALAVVDNLTWKVLLLVIGSVAKDALLFLKDHPSDKVEINGG